MRWNFWAKPVKHKFDGRVTQIHEEYGGTQTEADTIKKCYAFYKTDAVLRLVIKANVSYSIGDGYHLVSDKEDNIAENRKKILQKFLDENDFERFLHQVAQEIFLTGNSFIHFKGKNNQDIQGFQVIPITSIIDILRDKDGNVTSYKQLISDYKNIKPDTMTHFSRGNENGSAWGTGLGQPYVTQGVGYTDTDGKQVPTPSLASQAEMLRNILIMAIYYGSPRHIVTANADEDDMAQIKQFMESLKPNQSFVSGTEFDVKTMSHSGKMVFDPFLTFIKDQITMSMQSPVPSLFPNPANFAYASSQTSKQMAFPEIDSFQRQFKTFIEQKIFRPYLERVDSTHSWEKHPIELVWGKEDNEMETETILKLIDAKLKGMPVTWESLIQILQDQGFPVQPDSEPSLTEQEQQQVQTKREQEMLNRILHKFEK